MFILCGIRFFKYEQKIQVNYTDIRNKLAEQKQLLLAYKEYYETPEGEEAE